MKNNKGISLIVLIITVVVIIILGTAIIVNIAKTNIIGNANEAVVKQDFKTMQEELDMYIADLFVDTKGTLDITTVDASTQDEVKEILKSSAKSKYIEYVTIVDGKIVISDTMPEEQKEWASEAINGVGNVTPSTPTTPETPTEPEDPKEPEVTPDGEEIVFDNTEGTANVTINGGDFAYNNPVVPVGFMAINTTDAKWSDADGWNKGLVIEDGSGNEFVWVPCVYIEDDETETEVEVVDGLVEYKKRFDEYPKDSNISSVTDDKEALPMKNENENIDETQQIKYYHGFYIGRYEAGVPANQTTIDGKSKDTSDVDGIPVVQKDATVWTRISYNKARPNAKSFINTTNVKSGLLTGIQWDTVCGWIQSETDSDGNSVHDVINDSKNWGNYSNDPVDGNNGKHTAGFKEEWKAKNIYDFAGNTWEWTGESYSTYRVFRGGPYCNGGSTYPASYRGYSNPAVTRDSISFRLVLYVM